MWPRLSSQTPCVLPYLMSAGSAPQSCVTSYVWSPEPRIGFAEPDLFVIPKRRGAPAPTEARKLRRVFICVKPGQPETISPLIQIRGAVDTGKELKWREEQMMRTDSVFHQP